MADITASTWDQTDASNTTASPDGAPEGMAPSGVNNTMRMMMGALKRAYVWSNVPTTTAGTTTAYTLSYSVAPTALVDGMVHVVSFNATCGASPTLNVNSLGAKPLHYFTGSAWAVVPAGFIVSGMVCPVSYNSGAGTYRIRSFPSSVGAATVGANNAFTGDNTFAGTSTFSGTVTMSAKAINEAVRVDVASATTCDIGAAASNYVRITGTTTITGLGTVASGVRRHVVFGGVLILTHNATSLILPNASSNITTAAGDTALFLSEGSGNWRCLDYQRLDGTPLVSGYTAPQRAYAYGTQSGGTVTLVKSSGVTSIVQIGTGSYEVTLSSAMPDANYRIAFTPRGATNIYSSEDGSFSRTTTKFRLSIGADNSGATDPDAFNLEVFA